jgi:hypothetical protein
MFDKKRIALAAIGSLSFVLMLMLVFPEEATLAEYVGGLVGIWFGGYVEKRATSAPDILLVLIMCGIGVIIFSVFVSTIGLHLPFISLFWFFITLMYSLCGNWIFLR